MTFFTFFNILELIKKLSLREQFSGAFDITENHSRSLPQVSLISFVCHLYQNALLTFRNTQIEIISGIFNKIENIFFLGLCREDTILLQLWNFVNNGGLNNYLSYLSIDPAVLSPHFASLHLFADIAYSLIS